jgi:hypothetical protein
MNTAMSVITSEEELYVTNTVGVQQKKWTGWDLNPRPQRLRSSISLSSRLISLCTISTHMQLTLSFGSYGQIRSQVQKLGYSSKTTFVNV